MVKKKITGSSKPYSCSDCGKWVVGTKYVDRVGAKLCRSCHDKYNKAKKK